MVILVLPPQSEIVDTMKVDPSQALACSEGTADAVLNALTHKNVAELGLASGAVQDMNRKFQEKGNSPKILLDECLHLHSHIDFVDNDEQLRVIKHHYWNEFGHLAIEEILKDYSEDATIHELVNSVPHTFHGKAGARKAFEDISKLLPPETTEFDLRHISVNGNHAQVHWIAETPSHETILGTDSFTFDSHNRIETQTIVALAQPDE